MDLFGLGMASSYESRKVARFEGGEDFFVSTVRVTDADEPYETAVAHPKYNDGKIIVVETYSDIEVARQGHERWVGIMTAEKLPRTLEDVSTAFITKLCDLGEKPGETWRLFESD